MNNNAWRNAVRRADDLGMGISVEALPTLCARRGGSTGASRNEDGEYVASRPTSGYSRWDNVALVYEGRVVRETAGMLEVTRWSIENMPWPTVEAYCRAQAARAIYADLRGQLDGVRLNSLRIDGEDVVATLPDAGVATTSSPSTLREFSRTPSSCPRRSA